MEKRQLEQNIPEHLLPHIDYLPPGIIGYTIHLFFQPVQTIKFLAEVFRYGEYKAMQRRAWKARKAFLEEDLKWREAIESQWAHLPYLERTQKQKEWLLQFETASPEAQQAMLGINEKNWGC